MKKYLTDQNGFWLTIIFLLLFTSFIAYGQPSIQWQKSIGGSGYEETNSIRQTADGGFIAIISTNSTNGDFAANTTSLSSSAVVKYDPLGILQWQQFYVGVSVGDIKQTYDGGYILAGSRYIYKIDAVGGIQWQKTLSVNNLRSVTIAGNGDYFVAGTDTGVVGNTWDFFIARFTPAGTLVWEKTYGGTAQDGAVSVIGTVDGGCVASGYTNSNNGDVTGYHGGVANNAFGGDCWVVKLDSTGSLQWQKTLGGSLDEFNYYSSIVQTADKGYVIGCGTNSTDGDVSGKHNGTDAWIVKLDSIGIFQSQKCIGGAGGEHCRNLSLALDGGFFMAGITSTNNNGDFAGFHGGSDAWMMKLDASANIQYQKCLGGTSNERGHSISPTTDGGCIIGGNSNAVNGDVTSNKGGFDGWIIKLFPVSNTIIKGMVYEDLNGNCIKDSAEIGLPGRTVKAMPGNYYASTDANGNYTLFVDSGTYVVSHTPPTYWNQSCPAASGVYNVTINTLNPNSYGNNFADTLTSHCADLKLSINTPFLRRCFKNTYAVSCSNIGAVAATNVTVAINFDPDIIPLSSSQSWTFTGGQYVFSLGTLQPGQNMNFTIIDSVACSAVNGTVKCATSTITTTDTECNLVNNYASICRTVNGSYDPNGLEVESQVTTNGYVLQENITAMDTLTYMIHFQNTGTDTAMTVVVRDTLSNYLEGASIELGAASHAYTFRMYGQGICEWTFNNILLPDSTNNELASHGFLKFSVKQISGNMPGTTIRNASAIWFDYNTSVVTNETFNFIPLVTGINEIKSTNSGISVYPNPFSSSTIFSVKEDLKNAELIIYDVIGHEVFRNDNVSGKQITLNRSNLTSGLYFYSIIQNNTILYSGKLVAE